MNRRNVAVTGAMLVATLGAYVIGRAQVEGTSYVRSVASMRAVDGHGAVAHGETIVVGISPRAGNHGSALPFPGTPLRDSFADLQARAAAGDAGAATRLYHDLARCSMLRRTQDKTAAATDDLTSRSTEGMRPDQLHTYEILLKAMELRQQVDGEARALCEGAPDSMLDNLIPSIAQAARLGDEDARACYLGRGPLYDTQSLVEHPESLRAYRETATALVDAGLAAGDWRVVDLLQQAYAPGAPGLLAGVVGVDSVQHYRYLKLYRLGAEAHRADKLDRELAAATAGLSSMEVADADRWAEANLRDHFEGNSTSATPEGWETCAF